MIFHCKLGLRDYAIADAGKRELSDRWEDALLIRHAVEDICRKLEAEEAT